MDGFERTIARLQRVVEQCQAREDRAGYFAALYLAVTRTIRARREAGMFDDGARMERFAALFAARYLDAEEAWRRGAPLAASWRAALGASTHWRPVILQHLLLGVNAHVNLDLGVTAATVRGGDPIDAIRADFDAVNDVLADLVECCQGALGQVSPWLDWCDRIGASHDEALINFSLQRARAHAWSVAVRLAALDGDALAAEIARVDAATAGVAHAVAHPGIPASAVLLAVRLRERAAPSRVIEVLAAASPPLRT
jgi:hypothetical protein